MKMLKNLGSLGKKREGFTLIELLIVMVILAILAGIVIISIGGVIGRGQATAYNADREQIQAAVAEFMTRPSEGPHTIGEVPALNATVVNVTGALADPYYPIAMCPLLTTSFPKGILKNVPDTTSPANGIAEVGSPNAWANVTACAADCTGSYVWLTTDSGDIASICAITANPDCKPPALADGFRDAYP